MKKNTGSVRGRGKPKLGKENKRKLEERFQDGRMLSCPNVRFWKNVSITGPTATREPRHDVQLDKKIACTPVQLTITIIFFET